MLFLLLACGQKILNFDQYYTEVLPSKFSRKICEEFSKTGTADFEKLNEFPSTGAQYLYRLEQADKVTAFQCISPQDTDPTKQNILQGLQLLTQENATSIVTQLSERKDGIMTRFPIIRVQDKDLKTGRVLKDSIPTVSSDGVLQLAQNIRADFMKEPQNINLKNLLQDAGKELELAQTVSQNEELTAITDLLNFINVLNRWDIQSDNDRAISVKETDTMSKIPSQNQITLVQNNDTTYFLEYSHSEVYVHNTTVDPADLIQCMNDCHCPFSEQKGLTEGLVSFQFAQNYCSYLDMRLPTESELWTIVHDTELQGGIIDAEWTSSPFSMSDWMSKTPEGNVDGNPVLVKTANANSPTYIVGERMDSTSGSMAKFRCVQDEKPTSFPKVLSQPLNLQWNANYSATSFAHKDADYQKELKAFGERLTSSEKSLDISKFSYSYKDIGMVEEILWAYHKAFPDVTQIYHLGYSRDKRPLLAIRVTDNPLQDEPLEPAILINGAHHGDEQLSVLYALKDLDTVLKDYQSFQDKVIKSGTNTKKTSAPLLQEFDFWFIPLVNPDGNWQTLRQNKKYNVGRKNGRNTDGQCEQFPNLIDTYKEGVDLNRNYPFCWGCLGERGSKSKKSTFYYRGEKAASEPESQALIALANHYHFIAGISWHTNGTMIISPYTIEGNRSPLARNIDNIIAEEVKETPNVAWKLAENMVASSPVWSTKRSKEKPLVVKSSMYPVDGTDQDWHFHEHGTLAYIIEGSHHNPVSIRTRKKSVKYIEPLMPTMLDNLQHSPAIFGKVVDENGTPLEATVMVREHKFYEKENWTSRPSDGYFYRLVMKPGTYTIVVQKEGYQSVKEKVKLTGKTKQKSITVTMLKEPTEPPSTPE